jgi:hypothetical protein
MAPCNVTVKTEFYANRTVGARLESAGNQAADPPILRYPVEFLREQVARI